MVVDVSLADAAGLRVTGWKTVDGELHLQVAGAPEIRSIVCRCGRRHWMVRTVVRSGTAVLAVRCHGCGRSGEFSLEGFRIPSP